MRWGASLPEKKIPQEELDDSVKTTAHIIKKIRQRAGNIPIIAFNADSHNSALQDAFRKLFDQNNIPFMEDVPKKIAEKQREGAVVLMDKGGHWNQTGHLICGQALAEYLIKRK